MIGHTKTLEIGLLLLLFNSCSTEPTSSEQVFTETRKIKEKHIQAHYDKNPEEAANQYHHDYKLYYEGGVVVGRERQKSLYAKMYKRMTITNLKYTPEEFKVAGDFAYENGIYEETYKLNNNDSLINETYRYISIWTFTDSTSWKLWQSVVVLP